MDQDRAPDQAHDDGSAREADWIDEPERAMGGDQAASEGPYDWYQRGLALLQAGSAAAAEQPLTRAAAAEPASRSVLEALGRAQFEARHYARAKATFTRIIEADPTDDYGQFALGLSAARIGELRTAVEHLALAAAMRPDLEHYGRELRMARARLEGAT
jgi:tetratricopeptide (TPR) repeat protein